MLEEADLFAPGEGDPEEGDRMDDCGAGLLGAVLVVLLALAATRVSRDTDI